MKARWLLGVLAVLLDSTSASAQPVTAKCPQAPDPGCKGMKCEDSCGAAHGDPVLVRGVNAWDRTEDVSISTSLGPVRLIRTFTSHDDTWQYISNNVFLANFPRPFGRSWTAVNSQKWTHNFFSLIYENNSQTHLVLPGGGLLELQDCAIPPGEQGCWVPMQFDWSPHKSPLLWKTSTGYEFIDDDGERLSYRSQVGSGTSTYWFLSAMADRAGRTVASVQYATPTVDAGTLCPGAPAGGSPYVESVTTADSQQLRFKYKPLPRATGGCWEYVLHQVFLRTAGPVDTLVAEYDYQTAPDGGHRSGNIASVSTPGSTAHEHLEEYYYLGVLDGGSGYWRFRDEVTKTAYHTSIIPSSQVTSTTALGHLKSFVCVNSAGCPPPQWVPQSCPEDAGCCKHLLQSRTIGSTEMSSGDGTGMTADASTIYVQGELIWGVQEVEDTSTLFVEDHCTGFSCSPGMVQYYYAPGNQFAFPEWSDGGGAGCNNGPHRPYIHGIKDKRDSWLVGPKYTLATTSDAGTWGPASTWLQQSTSWGAANQFGGGALQSERYSWSFSGDGARRLENVGRASALGAADAGTLYRYPAGSSQVDAVFEYGNALSLDGGADFKLRATFLKTTSVCAGGSADPLGRVLAVEGPCFVASTSAMGCGGDGPLTELSYYGTGEPNANAGRLKDVKRYKSSGCGSFLKTEFSGYTPEGDPTVVTDVDNSVVTNYTYDAHRVTSVTRNSRTWSFTWQNGELTSVQYPDAGYLVICHREGSPTGDCNPSNQWSKKPKWIAKATNATASTWSERLVIDWWPDDTLKQIDAVDYAGGANEVRRVQKFAADMHLRPTWSQVGEGSGSFKLTRGFDGANNPTALQLAYNTTAPTFCRTGSEWAGSAKSPLCTWLEFDRADRPAAFDVFPTGAEPGERTCFDYDAQGNVNRVAKGCSASLSSFSNCSINTGGATTCDAAPSDFQFDDFGNLVWAKLPNTNDGAGGRGVVRYEYDALGSVTRKVTPQLAADGKQLQYAYDRLGRLTTVSESLPAPPYLVTAYSLSYDSVAPPVSCGTASYQGGRLAKVTDPLFDTWFGYTAEGYLAKEIRSRDGGCSSSDPTAGGGSDSSTHTLYEYTAAGDLQAVTYPHGRKVSYGYGADSRRVTSVSVQEWTGSAWSSRTLLSNVAWEPFGGLRGYVTNFATSSTTATVEYMLGENAQAEPVTSCPSSFSGSYDKSGRLRALRVQSGTIAYGASGYTGDLYRRTYVWQGDQVAQTRTCLKGSTNPQTELFQYDKATRLTSTSVPNFSSTGGYQSGHQYTYNSRGNRTQWVVDACCGSNLGTYAFTGGQQPDQLSRDGTSGSTLVHSFTYDKDGRVEEKRWPTATGSSFYGDVIRFEHAAPGADSALSSVVRRAYPMPGASWTNPVDATWTYVHDAWRRRIAKVYPVNDVRDEFFYDTQRQLLEDRGLRDMVASELPIDEYVWLGGRPVAQLRAKFSSSFVRAADRTGTCARWTDGSNPDCDFYFIVSDHIGKPVLMLNSGGRIVGVGEYDPFGRVNAVEWWNGSASPYGGTQWFGQFAQPTFAAQGMTTQLRAYYSLLDLERNCTTDTVRDGVAFYDASSSAFKGAVSPLTHWMRGNQYSGWMTEDSSSGLNQYVIDVSGTGTHYAQGNCSLTQSYRGAHMRRYEYRRYEKPTWWGTGTAWKWTLSTPPWNWMWPNYNDSSWPAAVDEGAYGTAPWYSSAPFPTGTPAHWIWHYDSRSSSDMDTVYFRKSFWPTTAHATLTITADNSFTAYLNGGLIASGSNWTAPVVVDVNLSPGTVNVLNIVASNSGGPGGLLVDVAEKVEPLWTALRFPGQYFDAETDLHENGWRFYDPEIGIHDSLESIQRSPYSHVAYAHGGYSLPAYGYALSNPVDYVDPSGRDTIVNIWRGFSSHASVYIDHGTNGPTLFDPAGSAFQEWIVSDDDVLSDYQSFWKNSDPIQEQYRFKTTAAEEAAIEAAFLAQNPTPPQPFFCAIASSNAISGIGPFKHLGPSFTPGGLGNDLRWLSKPWPFNPIMHAPFHAPRGPGSNSWRGSRL